MESLLWKIATLSLLTINISHYQLVYLYIYHPRTCGRVLAGKPTKDIWEFYTLAPRWLIYVTHWFGMMVYMVARLYILTEGWVGLRALPKSLYLSVNWSNYIHMCRLAHPSIRLEAERREKSGRFSRGTIPCSASSNFAFVLTCSRTE